MTIYEIFAGDSYGISRTWILTGPDGIDLDALWAEFQAATPNPYSRPHLKARLAALDPAQDSAGDYLLTRVFVAWLCKEHGFSEPGTVFLMTEG